MKTKKLNKSELLSKLTSNINEVVLNSGLVAQTKQDDMIEALMAAIAFAGPITVTSTKVTDEGVYCNYFQTYFPEADFKTKTNNKKHGKLLGEGYSYEEAQEAATGWQANSINANLIIRKAKAMRKRLEQQAMREYRFSRLTEAEMNTLLDIAEQITEVKYESVDTMPSLWDLIQPELGDDTANMIDKD